MLKYPVEYIADQVRMLDNSTSFTHFQIPYEKRGDGIVAGTFEIIFGEYSIKDDSDGNLVDPDKDKLIGNIFYSSGNIFIISDGYFGTSDIRYKDLSLNEITINYQRKAFFIHNKFYIDIDQDEYTYSSNETFKDSDAPHPFLTSVNLYNNKNELIAVARLSKPVSTETDIFLILDDLETL